MNVCTAARAWPERRLGSEAVGVGARELHERAQRGRRRLGLLVLAEHHRLLGDDPPEHRVARVLRDPLAAQERQVGEVEVARAPAEHRRVERDHDRLAAARLGARDEALDEVVVGAPVELEPARRVAELARARLHRARRLVGEDHRHALGARRRARRRGRPRRRPSRARRPGTSRNGDASRRPNSSTDVSRSETSRSIRGTIRQRSKPSRLARTVAPVPAPPAM